MITPEPNMTASSTSSSSSLRKRSRTSSGQALLQLYRPATSCADARELLESRHLTDEDILDFLQGSGQPSISRPRQRQDEGEHENSILRRRFYERRTEIRDLADRLNRGESRIDEDGRLVAVTQPPQPPRQNLPPPPLQPIEIPDMEQEEERLLDQEEREARETVARAVRRYREQHVPEEDFEVVLIEPREGGAVNLTFRRICIAVLAVVTAFVCVILQTLPLMQPAESLDPDFDKLMHELLNVRLFQTHIKHCPELHRTSDHRWQDAISRFLGLNSEAECDDGVLHIPARHVLLTNFLQSPTEEEAIQLRPYATGINVTWFMPCEPLRETSAFACYPGSPSSDTCKSEAANLCFRGVHDNIVSDTDIDNALRLGNYLILQGGDHFDIHYDTSHLEQRIPLIINKLRMLLLERYNMNGIQPVAFRVNTVGPMDGYGVNLYRSPALTLNQTVR